MLNNLDLHHLLTFPFADAQARRNFFIGTAVALAGFIIPIVPYLIMYGYTARIMRQVLAGQKPQMVEWDDWGAMLRDGFNVFVVRLAFTIPLVVVMAVLLIGIGVLPVLAQGQSQNPDTFLIAMLPLMLGIAMLFVPFSLALSVTVPAAEAHTVAHNDLSAGLRVREWWKIFRANWGGFLIAFVIYMAVSMGLMFAIQFALITLVFICLLPLVMPAYTMYASLIMYTAFAQAYKEGVDRINTAAVEINHASA